MGAGLAVGGVRAMILLGTILTSAIVQPTSAYYFEGYVSWANAAVQGGPADPSCRTSATDFLDFVYAVVTGVAPTVGTVNLTQTCTECSAALDSALTFMPSGDPGICPLLPDVNLANRTALSLRRFVCLGDSPGGSGAGSCVVRVVAALQSCGLLDRVSSMDPSLTFTGSELQGLCTALFPPPPAEPSCCGRTWSYLMAALAQQSCMPALAKEYTSLPGRCEAVLNGTVAGFCEASWPSDLMPLLTPPGACASAPGASVVPSWVAGSACSTDQLRQLRTANDTCDLWCGLVGDMQRVEAGEIPGPIDAGGGNNSATAGTPPPDGDDGGGGGGLQTSTIVVISVFSALIFVLLVVLAVFAWWMYRENKAIAQSRYRFDAEINFVPTSVTPPPDAASADGKGEPLAARGSPAPLAPRPLEAAAAAAAGGVMRTPRYQPGPVQGGAAGAAAGGSLGAAGPSQRGGGAASRALVFGDAGGSSANSRSSKYESATSLIRKSGSGFTTFITPGSSEDVLIGDKDKRLSSTGSDNTAAYHSAHSPQSEASMLEGSGSARYARAYGSDGASGGASGSGRGGSLGRSQMAAASAAAATAGGAGGSVVVPPLAAAAAAAAAEPLDDEPLVSSRRG